MIRLQTILETLGDEVETFAGDPDAQIDGPASILRAGPTAITFCNKSGEEAQSLIRTSNCLTFIVSPDVAAGSPRADANFIAAKNPRLTFLRVIQRCFTPTRPTGIHPSAFVHAEAHVAETAYIGPMCYIGRSTVGEGTVLWGNVFVYDRVTIGDNVTIHAGSVLGADGFGYERSPDRTMEKFPHVGGIVVEDDVEIGSNACIDRGTLDDTTLKRGAKIDNLVHIAHNVVVGEDAVVIAHAMVGGSTKIGPRAWIAPSACLRDQITIGDDAVVGLASVVTKNVTQGSTVLGSPAREISEQMALLKKLKQLLEEK